MRLAGKYGWRLPFVALHFLQERFSPAFLFRRGILRALCRGAVSASAKIEADVFFTPRSRVAIGEDVFIGTRSIFEVLGPRDPLLEIADGAWISHDCHIQTASGLRIGR